MLLFSTALALTCSPGDLACEDANALATRINDLASTTLVADTGVHVRRRTQTLADRIQSVYDAAQADGCTIDGSAAALYDRGVHVGDWVRGATSGTQSGTWTRPVVLGSFDGDADGTLGAWGRYNPRTPHQVAARWGSDGFVAGFHARTSGRRGIAYAVIGTCPGDAPTALVPYFPALSADSAPEGGLLFYLPLDSDDDSAQGIEGVADVGVVPGADRFGNAGQARCFSHERYIRLDDGSNLDTFAGVSTSAFIRQDAFNIGNNPVVGKWDFTFESEQYGWFARDDDNLVAVGRADHIGHADTSAMAAGTWYHVAFTYDKAAQRSRIYVDGVLTASSDTGVYTASDGTNLPLLVGGIDGCLDEVRVYDRELTEAEVQQLAQELAP